MEVVVVAASWPMHCLLLQIVHIGSRCWCHFCWRVKLVSLIGALCFRLSCGLPSVGLPVDVFGLPVVPVVPMGGPTVLV